MKTGRLVSLTRNISVALFLFITTFANAQNEAVFLGSIDSLWSNPGNWSEGLKPNENVDYVTINKDVLIDEDVTIQNLRDAEPCTLTVKAGKKMTVLASIDWNNGNFILENASQLVYQQDLHAILKKKIVAFDQDTHALEFIASPVLEVYTPSLENGFLTDPDTGFDLVYYNESDHKWVDFHDTPFNLENGHGYAYINALDTVLVFEGKLKGSATPVEVSLDYHANNGGLAGCNLVGNPLPCNALTDRSYYTLDGKGKSLLAVPASSATVIPPCKGIFVKAESAGEVVSFSKTEDFQMMENAGYVELYVSKTSAQDAAIDNAIVSFNSGDDLGKFLMFEEQPSLFFAKDGKDLAIMSVDSVDALPLKFKAAENTSYTMKFEQKELNLNYLHLIDNLAGNNIDLLTTPTYTFTANTNDYASRFKLVFDPHYGVEENGLSTNFAYYADGVIYIQNIDMQNVASLQIADMNGRIVHSEAISSRDGVHTVSTKLIPGIYVLRLVSGNAVMTQKMVIN